MLQVHAADKYDAAYQKRQAVSMYRAMFVALVAQSLTSIKKLQYFKCDKVTYRYSISQVKAAIGAYIFLSGEFGLDQKQLKEDVSLAVRMTNLDIKLWKETKHYA